MSEIKQNLSIIQLLLCPQGIQVDSNTSDNMKICFNKVNKHLWQIIKTYNGFPLKCGYTSIKNKYWLDPEMKKFAYSAEEGEELAILLNSPTSPLNHLMEPYRHICQKIVKLNNNRQHLRVTKHKLMLQYNTIWNG